MSSETKKIYHAAELFHLPARLFNHKLTETLEERGYSVFNPQRDGFEFTQLVATLRDFLSPEALDHAMQSIIYSYDVLSISKSDVIVARFDEPSDPGVDTEVMIANALGIPVIAYRTDVRGPYGASSSKYGGMHSFPVKTSETIIMVNSSTSPEGDFQTLTDLVVKELQNLPKKEKQTVPNFLEKTFKTAHLLFDGIEDIHSEEGLKILAQRCLENTDNLFSFGPKPVRG